MKDYRYLDTARTFDEELLEDLFETARENATKQAEALVAQKERASGGLERIATKRTPLEEVKALLAQNNTAPAEIRHHEARQALRKVASRPQRLVDTFLSAASHQITPLWRSPEER